MIYLDHAATSWPKPDRVLQAVQQALAAPGGNVGRSSHAEGFQASETVYAARENLARLFAAPDPLRICFAANTTAALNQALQGWLRPGDHAVCSGMEHNAVWRPLVALARRGVAFTIAQADESGRLSVESVLRALRPNTRLVAVAHASNVNGAVQPVEEIGAAVRARGAAFLVDAAQSAGALPIDVEAMGIDLLAFPGHKALLGPQGTGGLYVREGIELDPVNIGGTGSHSESPDPPAFLPDRLESGTLNLPGVAGLNQGVLEVLTRGVEAIHAHEMRLRAELAEGLRGIDGVRLYEPGGQERAAVVAFNLEGWDPVEVAAELEKRFGVVCRAGLHCAWLAHRTLGTAPAGAVRFSLGPFTQSETVTAACAAVRNLARQGK